MLSVYTKLFAGRFRKKKEKRYDLTLLTVQYSLFVSVCIKCHTETFCDRTFGVLKDFLRLPSKYAENMKLHYFLSINEKLPFL